MTSFVESTPTSSTSDTKPKLTEITQKSNVVYQKPVVESASKTSNVNKRKRESYAGIQPVKLAPNPFNMTARNFPKRKHMPKSTNGFLSRKKVFHTSPSQSLDQVRAALQPSLNTEIEKVLQSYQEMFRLAAYNIGDNLKETVTEDHISQVLRNSLEEAKKLFKLESDDFDKDKIIEKVWTPARNVIIKKKTMKLREEKHVAKVIDTFDYPVWNEGKFTGDIEMIIGVKANKILGFSSARGRLYSRHPQLFKYLGDQDDKIWLSENGHLPLTGGKAFLMFADDIRLLATSHPDYKDNLGIKAEDVKGFIIPEFLLRKVKLWMKKQALIQKVRKSTDSPCPSVD